MADNAKASLGSRSEFSVKLLIIDMPGRFGEQQSGTWFQSSGGFAEEWSWPRHFVHHGKGEHEVNCSNLVEAHRGWRNHACIEAIK